MGNEINEITGWFDSMSVEIATVAVAVIFGLIAIRMLLVLVKRLLLMSRIDNAMVSFIMTCINVILNVGLLLFCLRTLNISLTSLIAVLSAVGVAIGLAIQDSIANVANGIVMIGTRPFKVGDYVQIGEDEGNIEELRLMNTVLTTRDNRRLILPNKMVFNSKIVNYNMNPLRKLSAVFNVDYDTDIDEAIKLTEKALKNCTLVKKEPAPKAYLKQAASHSLDIELWYWCDSSNAVNANYEVQKAVYDIYKANDINIPFEQLTISEREKKKPVRKTAAVRKAPAVKAEAPEEMIKVEEATAEKKPAARKTASTAAAKKTAAKAGAR